MSKLTLLHVLAKYVSGTFEWDEQEQEYIKRLVQRSNNLTLKNNLGNTILKTMKNVNACQKNINLMSGWIKDEFRKKMAKTAFLLRELHQREKLPLPNRFTIQIVMKYID